MVLNTIDMLQWTDKKLTTCLILLLLELFLDGKLDAAKNLSNSGLMINRKIVFVDKKKKQVRKVHRQRLKSTGT